MLLDENNELWVEVRHQHIAVVSHCITGALKKFTDSKEMGYDKPSVKDLAQLIKKIPAYKKVLSKYTTHLQLAEDCMKASKGYLDKLCLVEQVFEECFASSICC